MNIKIENIVLDASIQCRATIDTGIVSEYAERMTESDKFPPVILYGTPTQCWIGDGWHRVMAAKQIGAINIPATLSTGGRAEALKQALGANAIHGHRRTNADKRRCVEIALREFGKLSDRGIAQMCGVGHPLVAEMRGQLEDSSTSNLQNPINTDLSEPPAFRTGRDGKSYPVNDFGPPPVPPAVEKDPNGKVIPTKLLPLWARRQEIQDILTSISRIKAAIRDEKDPLFAELNLSYANSHLDQAYTAVKATKPYCVCPYCQGEGCRGCRHRGLIGKDRYDTAPRELRQ
jgi:hypothetical protein